MITPLLSDGVVTLRAPDPDDVADIVEMASDPDTARWTSMPVPYDRCHARTWLTETAPRAWADGTAAPWVIEADDSGTPRCAGNLAIRRGPVPEIGFSLAPWARGRGLMSRAVRLALRWAFTEVDLPVVHWSAHAGNLASWRVAHACGFTFHGERPSSIPQRGALRDGWFASIRPGDPTTPRTTWWPTPVLDGDRIRLRAHTEADVERLVETRNDEQSQRWLIGSPGPYTAESARTAIAGWALGPALGRHVTWAVADRADDRLLGGIGVFDLDDPMNPTGGEIGYWAHPDARGRGVVREAVALVVDHAFRPRSEGGLGRHRLALGTAWPNAASRHVAERAGFTLVGRHRMGGVLGNGEITDGAWYDLLATDRT